ncbi:hypothetical protein [uncultured Bradyrhizobium sp.]|uniref:hypothetical protein n=1 Tax=uncultured Bradyrhizobium sp. TaxID=199684 RepID=UPI0035CA7E41
MSEAVLILPNMRGGCATVGTTVHTLFRITNRRPRPMARPDGSAGETLPERGEAPADASASRG